MKKALLRVGVLGIMGMGLFSYSALASGVEFKLHGSVEGKVGLQSAEQTVPGTQASDLGVYHSKDINDAFFVNGVKKPGEVSDVSIWSTLELSGMASIKDNVGNKYTGHFTLYDKNDSIKDVYVSAELVKKASIYVGQHKFSDVMMSAGGANYDTDEDISADYYSLYTNLNLALRTTNPAGAVIPMKEPVTGKDILYDANTGAPIPVYKYPVPDVDTDLGGDSVARIVATTAKENMFVFGGYIALNNDQEGDGAYEQRHVASEGSAKTLAYGLGATYKHEFKDYVIGLDLSAQKAQYGTKDNDINGKNKEEDVSEMLFRLGSHATFDDLYNEGATYKLHGIYTYDIYTDGSYSVSKWLRSSKNNPSIKIETNPDRKTHTINLGIEYDRGLFKVGGDVTYSLTSNHGNHPGVKSSYLGLGAGISLQIVDGLIWDLVQANYYSSKIHIKKYYSGINLDSDFVSDVMRIESGLRYEF